MIVFRNDDGIGWGGCCRFLKPEWNDWMSDNIMPGQKQSFWGIVNDGWFCVYILELMWNDDKNFEYITVYSNEQNIHQNITFYR